MGKPVVEAPLEEYEKCGFTLRMHDNGSLEVRGVDAVSKGLAISCSTNIVIWGSKGNFILDPDEDGILVHIPVYGQQFTKPTNNQYRKFVDHGKWLIDIFYGIDPLSTSIVDRNFEDTFSMSNTNDGSLIIRRKFLHKMHQYKWPYELQVHPDDSVTISMKRALRLRPLLWVKRRLE